MKDNDLKFSNAFFPLMKFLKRTFNLNTGEFHVSDFADTSSMSNFMPNASVGDTSTISKLAPDLSPVMQETESSVEDEPENKSKKKINVQID
jgi:hypothetical protein